MKIEFRECPPSICNYYDKAPSAQRVLRASATILRDGSEQYTITHSFGKDTWRYVDHEWRLVKAS
jgi:hypothetical protein